MHSANKKGLSSQHPIPIKHMNKPRYTSAVSIRLSVTIQVEPGPPINESLRHHTSGQSLACFSLPCNCVSIVMAQLARLVSLRIRNESTTSPLSRWGCCANQTTPHRKVAWRAYSGTCRHKLGIYSAQLRRPTPNKLCKAAYQQ